MERNRWWAAALAVATVGGSLAAACLMPFVALATMAAVTLPRREGLATLGVAWAANQALGFGLLGYPVDAATLGWGFALGGAAFVAYAAVRMAAGQGAALGPTIGAAVLGFAGFEATLYAYGLAGGGTAAFTPAIVALLARSEAAWLAGLLVARALATFGSARGRARAPRAQ